MGVVKTATFDADRLVVKARLGPSAIRHFKIRLAIAIVSQIHHAVHFSRVRPFSLQFSDNAHSIPMRTARVLVFVDESNVVSSVRALGRKLDWLKLRDHLANADRGRELMEMVIYAGLPPPMPEWQSERDKKSKFLHWLRSNGFLVVAKDGPQVPPGSYRLLL